MKNCVIMGAHVQIWVECTLFRKASHPATGRPSGPQADTPRPHAAVEGVLGCGSRRKTFKFPSTNNQSTANHIPVILPFSAGSRGRSCTSRGTHALGKGTRCDLTTHVLTSTGPFLAVHGFSVLDFPTLSLPLQVPPGRCRFLRCPGAALRPMRQTRGLRLISLTSRRRRPLPRAQCLPLPGEGRQTQPSTCPVTELRRHLVLCRPTVTLAALSWILVALNSHFFFFNLSFTGCWTFTFRINIISRVIKKNCFLM